VQSNEQGMNSGADTQYPSEILDESF